MSKQFPEWAKILYRGARAGISAGFVAVTALRIDYTSPQEALKIVGITFGTAFLVSFGMWLRDVLDKWFGLDEESIPARVMPF